MQGASALDETLKKFPNLRARVFVIWEKVIDTDRAAPGTPVLGRITDLRAAQFWDPERFVSRTLGEKDEDSIVWDWVAVYPPGVKWGGEPLYRGRPVVKVKDKLAAVLAELGG